MYNRFLSTAIARSVLRCEKGVRVFFASHHRDPIADSIDINAEQLEPFYQLKMVSE